MHPPRQASNAEHAVQAPPDCGPRKVANSSDSRHTRAKPPSARTLPARKLSWMANGQA
jgi:hypothetical protein